MPIWSDMNGFPESGFPVLADVSERICLGTSYVTPLKPNGFIVDVVGNSRLAGTLTIAGALSGVTSLSIGGALSGATTIGASGTVTLSSASAPLTLSGATAVLSMSGASSVLNMSGANAVILMAGVNSSIGTRLSRINKGFFNFLDTKQTPTVLGEPVALVSDLFSMINQQLKTTSSPTFVGLTLSGLTTAGFVKNSVSGVLSFDAHGTNTYIPVANGSGFTYSANLTFTNNDIATLSEVLCAGNLSTGAFLKLPTTTSTVGQIVQNGIRILHTFVPTQQVPTYKNIFIGEGAGSFTLNNTTGAFRGTGNVGVGQYALAALTTGFYNFAFGTASGQQINTGSRNVLVGHNTGSSIQGGTGNICIGADSGARLSSGSTNTFIGGGAGYNQNTGSNCVAIGSDSMGGAASAAASNYNVMLGHSSAFSISTGSSNIFLGYKSGYFQTTTSNQLIIDNQGRGSAGAPTDSTNAIIYGIMSATTANQTLTFNAGVTVSYNLTVNGNTALGNGATDTFKVYGVSSIGDGGTTNYTGFDATGHQTMVGTAKPWEDLRVEPTVRQAAGTGVPSFEKYFDDVAGTSRGVFLYSFTDESVAGNEKEVFFTMQMPHAWDGGSISMHVHWTPSVTVNGSDVIWGLEYCWKEIGADYVDTTIVTSSATLVPDDGDLQAGRHYISEFTDLVPGTTADGLSSILIGRLFRNSSNVADTYTNKVGLLYIDAHYQISSIGSTDEYTK